MVDYTLVTFLAVRAHWPFLTIVALAGAGLAAHGGHRQGQERATEANH
jgi:hypothetical protein